MTPHRDSRDMGKVGINWFLDLSRCSCAVCNISRGSSLWAPHNLTKLAVNKMRPGLWCAALIPLFSAWPLDYPPAQLALSDQRGEYPRDFKHPFIVALVYPSFHLTFNERKIYEGRSALLWLTTSFDISRLYFSTSKSFLLWHSSV